MEDFPDGGSGGFFGVMYYIGKINTGVPPGLGGTADLGGWGWGVSGAG